MISFKMFQHTRSGGIANKYKRGSWWIRTSRRV